MGAGRLLDAVAHPWLVSFFAEVLAMSTEQNKKVVLRWREEIWNKRNVNIIDELHAPNFVGH